ncbi:MAG: MBL fold metallo-hydrolase [Fibrobacterota bacterium]|nr:MBL fold metallo-hydrolase [Chitinispirillaceae bacterium]
MGLQFRIQTRFFLGIFSLCFLLFGNTFGACAENLKPKAQVPGYYRVSLGQFQITALHDGNASLEGELFLGISEAEKEELLSRMFITGGITSSVNAYLINTGSKLVLVDAGGGNVYGSSMGHLAKNLREAGYRPHQIDAIVITHAHPDHIGGLLDTNDKPVFPRAKVYISVPESAFWLSEENEANAPETMKSLFALVQKIAAIYSTTDKWKTFYDGDTPIPCIPGIRAILTPGHSAGMAAFEVTSDNQKLLIWGDIVHASAIQMPKPFVSFAYDLDYGAAIATRLSQFEIVAAEKTFVAGSHLAFPGLGHVRKDGQQTYSWVPVDFSEISK